MRPELFDHEIHDVAAELVPLMSRLGRTVAVAESLTGGLVCGALTEIPGASAVLRGGAVTYATDSKHAVLGVSARLLGAGGPVQAQVAREMTLGVRRLYSADFGVATTGVAGPEPQSGQPVGRLFVAVGWSDADGEHDEVRMFDVPGDRSTVRARAVTGALSLLLEVVRAGMHRLAMGGTNRMPTRVDALVGAAGYRDCTSECGMTALDPVNREGGAHGVATT